MAMETHITGKNLDITDSIREYITRRAEKFPKYWDQISRVEVVAEKRGAHTYFVEFLVHANGGDPFVATEKHDDLYACVDSAASKSEKQLRNFHAKLVDHKS